ncbi:GIN domain-containing protein [Sphingomonas desiccabilis]|uniref:Putative auto-transporter adhesin head GIN domain-containing protein n=1 Tax=Sphingomonas desiccabilis TaxID=429134 RepID=A0A4Q2ISV4_9SPHN|nr:DUF2807 domain-containing protein [Sphingomonas desiccabilis]MBB3911695.1 hypothetical protein [Sphingomonas desiccabilis]RXZ31577.1 hypothetical protein EO081_10070 [Sphingomonas desiccabilis]
MLLLPILLALTAALESPEPPARTVMLTRFDRLRVSGSYVVEVVTGGRTGAEMLGDRASAERVSVQVEAGVLTIRPSAVTRDGFAVQQRPVTIRVRTAAPLQAVTLAGGGRVMVDRLAGTRTEAVLNGTGTLSIAGVAAEQLAGTLMGNGTLSLSGTARQARFLAVGSGSLDAAALETRDLVVRSEGAGTGRFRAALTATVTANGAGSVEVAGAAKCQVRGTSSVQCGAGS